VEPGLLASVKVNRRRRRSMMDTKRYRSLAVVALAIAALAASSVAVAAPSVALASGGLTGTYTTTIKSPAQLKGKWALTYARGGSYTVALNGQVVARGKYTSNAKTVTLDREQGSGCTGAGTYAWKRSGKTLSFTRKRESASCQERAVVLGHRFTQVR
jgi:hypothetical protein